MAIPTGEIYLLSNVPLTASYEHTIDFKDANEQYNYFMRFVKIPLSDYTYIRKEREYISVGLPLLNLDDINYLMFRSADGERLYYAFVTDKRYVSPGGSDVFFSIDVMQTFMFDYEWKASYIKQAHVDRWTAEHKPIYSKTDEGLDYGTEYSVESGYKIEQDSKLVWFVVTINNYKELIEEGSQVMSSGIYPIQSPHACLLLPAFFNVSDTSLDARDVVVEAGGLQDRTTISTYNQFMDYMMKSSIGKYISSISLLPYNPFIMSEDNRFGRGNTLITLNGSKLNHGLVKLKDLANKCLVIITVYSTTFNSKLLAQTPWNTGLEDSLPTEKQWEEIKSKPRTTKRDKRFESKLLCAPYRYNLLTDWRATPVIFKNEYMTSDYINIKYSFGLTSNVPFRYWIEDYKKDPEGRYTSLNQPLALEMPIVSDAYYAYMLENKNTIQANLTNAKIQAGANTISGAISGGGIGGVGGAIFGAISGATQGALNVSAMVRSENAKQADLKAQPDAIINANDSAFNVIDKNFYLNWYRMRICCENEEIISEIFNISGYKVNKIEIPNTRSRVRFNYIQTLGANIIGSISQNYLMQLKEIFDRGITIWHYSEKDFNFLDYSYENLEVNLL